MEMDNGHKFVEFVEGQSNVPVLRTFISQLELGKAWYLYIECQFVVDTMG